MQVDYYLVPRKTMEQFMRPGQWPQLAQVAKSEGMPTFRGGTVYFRSKDFYATVTDAGCGFKSGHALVYEGKPGHLHLHRQDW